MANMLQRMHDMMAAGVDPEKISGPGSGLGLQSQDPNDSGSMAMVNIPSQVDNSDSGSKKRKWRNDIESNAAKANEERPEEGRAEVTPRTGRGRPKGSRNKPKDPALSGISQISKKLKCYAFEIPHGNDVSKTLETFARRSQVGVSILSGNGMVSNVALRHPAARAGMRTYAGPLQILSLAGAFPHGTENQEATGIKVSLADVNGVVVAGSVVGNLVAFGRVFVVAGTVVDIHCERPNVQPVEPMPVQPCGLLQSSDLTEVQRQINMMSEIRSL